MLDRLVEIDPGADARRAQPVALVQVEPVDADDVDEEAFSGFDNPVEEARRIDDARRIAFAPFDGDRKSVVEGKSVSVRLDLGGRQISKKKRTKKNVQ